MISFERVFLIFVVFHSTTHFILCDEVAYEVQRSLPDKLLTNYSRDVRPVLDHLSTVKVSVDILLKSIIQYDEIDGVLSTAIGLYLTWKDEILTWNPGLYRNLTYVRLPQTVVWTPQLYTPNAADMFAIDNDDKKSVMYFYDGSAKYAIGFRSSTICSPNSEYFPFDTHTCYIAIVPLENIEELCLIPNNVILSKFEENPLWKLLQVHTTVFRDEKLQTSVFHIMIKLQRRNSFFMVNIFAPILFLEVINLCVYIVPVESGERISFVVTVLLSLSVFLTSITSNIPKSSIVVSILSIYILVILTYSSLITFSVIFAADIYFTEDDKTPRSSISRILVWIVHKTKTCGCTSVSTVANTDLSELELNEALQKGRFYCTNYKTISSVLDTFFVHFHAFLLVSTTVIFMSFLAIDSHKE
jgi:nicotinic acetylcholine receptor alpha-7